MSYSYLIDCQEDASYVLVSQADVICDPRIAKSGDSVLFWHGSKKWNGQILKKSRDENFLRKELIKLRMKKSESKPKNSPISSCTSETKIVTRKSRSFSPTECNRLKKMKLETSTVLTQHRKECKSPVKAPDGQNSTEDSMDNSFNSPKPNKNKIKSQRFKMSTSCSSNSDHANSDDEINRSIPSGQKIHYPTDNSEQSPTKDELKKMIMKLKAEFEMKNKMNKEDNIATKNEEEKSDPKNDLKDTDDDDAIYEIPAASKDHQLFGKQFPGEKMVHVTNGIYCKEREFYYAIGGSTQASHVARRLMDGVFKNEAVLRCTFTGTPPRAHGQAKQSERVETLDSTAKEAIIKFAMDFAAKKNWKFQPEDKVKTQMSQKLGEMKRNLKKKLQSASDA